MRLRSVAAVLLLALTGSGAGLAADALELEALERANPVRPLPEGVLGHDQRLADLPKPPAPERVRLGRWLFFDKRLSTDGTVACATCHRVTAGFSEPTRVSTGVGGRRGTRKAPSFLNVAFAFFPDQFWDGRVASLEDQAKGSMGNPREMGGSHQLAVRTVGRLAGYRHFFRKAFGDSTVTLARITQAIADYERSRISGNSPWDRYRRLGDRKALSESAQRGDQLFFGEARCSRCHISTVLSDPSFSKLRQGRAAEKSLLLVGNSFTDWRFHNTGVGWEPKTKSFRDKGRFLATGSERDLGAFKTPGLRDTALHPPYMHDGSLPTLAAVVEHYRKGGIDNPYLDPLMEPLELTDADARALVAFLESLTGVGYADEPPALFPR